LHFPVFTCLVLFLRLCRGSHQISRHFVFIFNFQLKFLLFDRLFYYYRTYRLLREGMSLIQPTLHILTHAGRTYLTVRRISVEKNILHLCSCILLHGLICIMYVYCVKNIIFSFKSKIYYGVLLGFGFVFAGFSLTRRESNSDQQQTGSLEYSSFLFHLCNICVSYRIRTYFFVLRAFIIILKCIQPNVACLYRIKPSDEPRYADTGIVLNEKITNTGLSNV